MYQVKKITGKAIFIFTFILVSNTLLAQQFSDKEIKKDIAAIDNALSRLIKLEPKSYQYNTGKFNNLPLENGKKYGFIAEDIALTFPELVGEKSYSYMFGKNVYRTAKVKTVDESSLIPVLVASIKEQQQQVEKLKLEIDGLKNNKTVAVN